MKLVHWLSLAATVIALGLFLARYHVAAFVVLGLTTAMEIFSDALTGKQTNGGMR